MKLKELLKIKNIKSKTLAKELGVNINTISDWNTEKRHIPDKYLPKLSEIFDLPMSEIMKLKYDFSEEQVSKVTEESSVYKKQINEYSNLPDNVLKDFLRTEKIILSKIEAGITALLNNGNDLETIEKLSKYQEFKKKVTEKIEEIKINL